MSRTGLLLWGKTVKGDMTAYHPLLFHLLDVGSCAGQLWDNFVSEKWRDRLIKALGLSAADVKRAVVLLAAWHDVGKAAPGFQLQESGPQGLRELLWQAGWPSSQGSAPHAQVSAWFLKRWLCDPQNAIWQSPGDAKVWAHITGAHHGFYPHSLQINGINSTVTGDASWQNARIALCQKTAELLAPGATLHLGTPTDRGAIAFLTGLIAVADWLGSSQFFPAAARVGQVPPSSEAYAQLAQERARDALEQFGWLVPFQVATTPLDFPAQFGFAPNPLQHEVIQRSANLERPFLAIVEAQMGTGKTEAAFAAIDAALRQKRAHGFYIALPTQATGNAMFDRVAEKFLAGGRHGVEVNLQLVHSHAFLHQLEISAPDVSDAENAPGEAPPVAPQEWFMGAKRPLLAPCGVGTIDQGLTGVLSVKHWFVRLCGLAGKIVVLDEVHAYSTYMSHLLDRLLGWLQALDCSVILLSATLPSTRRRELIQAWGAPLPAQEAAYPRLTWADEQTVSVSIAPPASEARTIYLDWCGTDARDIAARLREALAEGGCAAVICNTVKRAQSLFGELQKELEELGADWANWTLFHARMPFEWRQNREDKIKRLFGKPEAGQLSQRPPRGIVISTQVLEQSLDLDFDWMASELAPVDLLLQRAGRLHRHERTPRPKAHFLVLCDEFDGFPALDLPPEIYDHHTLLQTFRALHQCRCLLLPRDIEPLIERVYVRPRPASGLWQDRLDETRKQQQDARERAERNANKVLLPWASEDLEAEYFVEPQNALRADEEDPTIAQEVKATTRDGRPSVSTICLLETPDGLFLPATKNADEPLAPGQKINLGHQPDTRQTLQLMKFAVPIGHAGIYRELTRSENEATYLPSGWRRNAHLRYTRCLKFKDGRCTIGKTLLRLDPTLGLVIGELNFDAPLQKEDE